ncbi:hypothetical protein [Thomasclavelia sp.]
MLDECLRIFDQELKNNKNLVLSTMILADGDYVLVHSDGIYDVEKIKYSKRDHCLIEKPEDDIYDKLCFYDYQSQLVSMNKPQDPGKTIHSNNYLSLFVKKESFSNGKMNDEAIERYFKALENPQNKYKGKDLQMYNFVNDNIGEVDQEQLLKNKQWLKEHIYSLEGVDYNEKDYLKVFFEVDDQIYIDEGNRYLLTKIFNCNDYNVYDDGTVYGLPNYNLQLNAKKPFLENKTRMHKIPYMVSLEDALLQKQFFDYLLNQANNGKTNVYINTNKDRDKRIYCFDNTEKLKKGFNGIYFKTKKGKELEIHYIDVITDYKEFLNPLFDYENVIGALDDKCYREYKYRNDVEKLINEILFSKYLINNYFTVPDDIKSLKADSVYKKNLLACRSAIFAWVYTGKTDNIGYILPKAALEVVIYSIRKEYIKSAQKQLNLYFALNKYFNKQENNMEDVRENLRIKINGEHQKVIEDDLEYSFAVGQAIAYLQSKSKAKNKTQDIINQFIIIRNDAVLKLKLKQFYRRYNYSLFVGRTRFNYMFSMIMEYLDVKKIDQGMLLAGYLGENLIYEKGEKENG